MIMAINHTGRTFKETGVTFDTDNRIFCSCYLGKHDVYIYAEQTRDVKGVIYDLEKYGYQEVDKETFLETAYEKNTEAEIEEEMDR
jgi:hypothetical protein